MKLTHKLSAAEAHSLSMFASSRRHMLQEVPELVLGDLAKRLARRLLGMEKECTFTFNDYEVAALWLLYTIATPDLQIIIYDLYTKFQSNN